MNSKTNNVLIELANEFSKKQQANQADSKNLDDSINDAKRVICKVLNPKLTYKSTIKKVIRNPDRTSPQKKPINGRVRLSINFEQKAEPQAAATTKPEVRIESLKIPENNIIGHKIPVTQVAKKQKPRQKSILRKPPNLKQVQEAKEKAT